MTEGPEPIVAAMLDEATQRLREAGIPDPRREASTLLAAVLATDRGGLVARKPDPLSRVDAARFDELVGRRARRTPLQHILGIAEFRGLEFEVTPDVLIPRPETEDLVQAVLDAGLPETARVADLGTGSGCIAVSLAVEQPDWRVLAIDLSAVALEVAARNAVKHGVSDRIDFVESDFAALAASGTPRFDAVASNPPYVTDEEWRELEPEVRDHEPRNALVPGLTGNEAYAVVVPAAAAMLRPGGLLALELGWKSKTAVHEIVSAAGFRKIAVQPDAQGIPRVLTARK